MSRRSQGEPTIEGRTPEAPRVETPEAKATEVPRRAADGNGRAATNGQKPPGGPSPAAPAPPAGARAAAREIGRIADNFGQDINDLIRREQPQLRGMNGNGHLPPGAGQWLDQAGQQPPGGLSRLSGGSLLPGVGSPDIPIARLRPTAMGDVVPAGARTTPPPSATRIGETSGGGGVRGGGAGPGGEPPFVGSGGLGTASASPTPPSWRSVEQPGPLTTQPPSWRSIHEDWISIIEQPHFEGSWRRLLDEGPKVARAYDEAFADAIRLDDDRLKGALLNEVGANAERLVTLTLHDFRNELGRIIPAMKLSNGKDIDRLLVNKMQERAWVEVKFRVPSRHSTESFTRALNQIEGALRDAGPADRIVLYSLDHPTASRIADFRDALRRRSLDPARVEFVSGEQLANWLQGFVQ